MAHLAAINTSLPVHAREDNHRLKRPQLVVRIWPVPEESREAIAIACANGGHSLRSRGRRVIL